MTSHLAFISGASTAESAVVAQSGRLRLEDELGTKPLLLLAYLQRSGPATRQELAALLWPESASPQNCLRVALSHLRRCGVPIQATGAIVSVPDDFLVDETDVSAPFLDGADLSNVGSELVNWVMEQREQAATQVQEALLAVAATARDRYAALWQAWHLTDAPLASAATLARFLNLCPAGTPLHRALGAELAELAGTWGAELTSPLEQALLASWLEGHVTWLAGDITSLAEPVNRFQKTLHEDGQRFQHLYLCAPVDARLIQTFGTHDPSGLTLFVTPGTGLSDRELLQALATWPDIRFVVLGRVAPVGAPGLTLYGPDTPASDSAGASTAQPSGVAPALHFSGALSVVGVAGWLRSVAGPGAGCAAYPSHLPPGNGALRPQSVRLPPSRGDPPAGKSPRFAAPLIWSRPRTLLYTPPCPDRGRHPNVVLPFTSRPSKESFPAQLRIRTT
jgi:hypothetical protein